MWKMELGRWATRRLCGGGGAFHFGLCRFSHHAMHLGSLDTRFAIWPRYQAERENAREDSIRSIMCFHPASVARNRAGRVSTMEIP